MKKKLLFSALFGAPIGVTISLIITIIFSLCMGHGEYYPAPHELIDWCDNAVTAVIVQMFCSLFIGAVSASSFLIWKIEKWSLLKQTLVHFAVLAVPYFGIGYILNWLPHHLYGALGYVGGFALVYVIMWLSIYFSIKLKINKMNKQLQDMQQED
ncbi:MAG: DUF3021 domain-containing protein [Anaeroplasmataceae bacterium]|nr:DUF3021 domain-containing protein [Anaeroplasmataceae bacterium]